MNNYIVYKHTTPSGKVYIGITKQLPRKRWKNGLGYIGCTAFNRAITKYGWDSIEHEILAESLSEEEACELEQRYIAQYDSTNPEHGYNLTYGGEHYTKTEEQRRLESAVHKQSYIDHPELRARISEVQKGRKATEQTRRKMSESRKRYIALHPEAREKCRKTFKGMKRSAANVEKLRIANRKKVMCIETGATFDSVESAAVFAGVSRTSVSNVITGRSKTCGGYRFRYATE